MKTRHSSARTLTEDLELAYQAALKGELGRWRERILHWHGVDVISAKELIKRRSTVEAQNNNA